jgi:hypothetical protein
MDKPYRILFDNSGIPMWRSFETKDDAKRFIDSGNFKVLGKIEEARK